jgi:hypothetical protein
MGEIESATVKMKFKSAKPAALGKECIFYIHYCYSMNKIQPTAFLTSHRERKKDKISKTMNINNGRPMQHY